MPKINQEIIRSMPIPLAPTKEQERISGKIENVLTEKVRAKSLLMDSISNLNLLYSSALTHSIILSDKEVTA